MQNSKFAYICSPLKPIEGETIEENIRLARGYCKEVLAAGRIPMASHVMLAGLVGDDPQERLIGLALGCKLVMGSDEVWVYGPRISSGMQAEIALATALGIPVHWNTDAHL